jgi:hypothetical protein
MARSRALGSLPIFDSLYTFGARKMFGPFAMSGTLARFDSLCVLGTRRTFGSFSFVGPRRSND